MLTPKKVAAIWTVCPTRSSTTARPSVLDAVGTRDDSGRRADGRPGDPRRRRAARTTGRRLRPGGQHVAGAITIDALIDRGRLGRRAAGGQPRRLRQPDRPHRAHEREGPTAAAADAGLLRLARRARSTGWRVWATQGDRRLARRWSPTRRRSSSRCRNDPTVAVSSDAIFTQRRRRCAACRLPDCGVNDPNGLCQHRRHGRHAVERVEQEVIDRDETAGRSRSGRRARGAAAARGAQPRRRDRARRDDGVVAATRSWSCRRCSRTLGGWRRAARTENSEGGAREVDRPPLTLRRRAS